MNIILFIVSAILNFYSVTYKPLNGPETAMSAYAGKKILLVNIASNSPLKSQIFELEILQQEFRDSLVIIAFPSNSFGNEAKTNQQLSSYFTDSLQVTYHVAELSNVSGSNSSPVFNWLKNESLNGTSPFSFTKDFQKVLIDDTGKIMGVFGSRVSPTDPIIKNAIH
jgi:glutathione peroxidase